MSQSFLFSLVGSRIDSLSGIISGVSVITQGDVRGHKMQADAITLQQVKKCADTMTGGVKVKEDHKSGFDDIVGALRNFAIDGQQLRADLHLLKAHERFPVIVEMAQSQPETFGLSIVFSGVHDVIDGIKYARCSELYSVDLVDAPAANPSGLFSVDFKSFIEMFNFNEFFSELRGYRDETNAAPLAKALEEVTRLKAALATYEKESDSFEVDIKQVKSDLDTAKLSITSLTKERDDFRATIDKPEGEIEKRASAKATEIAASMGVKPINGELEKPTVDPADISAQLAAITDPVQRTEFFRKNEKAIKSASQSERAKQK